MIPRAAELPLFLMLVAWPLWYAANTRRHLFALGFLLPLMVPAIQIGVGIYLFSLVGLLSVAGLLMTGKKPRDLRVLGGLRPVVAWIVFITSAWAIAEYGFLHRYEYAIALGLGAGQSTLKMPAQLVSMALLMFAAVAVPFRARNERDVYSAMYGYLTGVAVSFVVGVISYLLTGRGFARAVTVEFEAFSLTRIGGLSGEPKMLGAYIVIALGLALTLHARAPRARRMFWLVIYGMLGVALIATLSTSAWLAFAVLIIALLLVGAITGRRGRSTHGLAAMTLLLGTLVGISTDTGRELIQRRVIQRVFDPFTTEVTTSKESYLSKTLNEKPAFALTGFGMGGADLEAGRHVSEDLKYHLHLQYVRTPTPGVSGVRLLGDIGIIGMVLFSMLAWRWAAVAHRERSTRAWAPFIVATFVAQMFMSFNSLSSWFFLAAAAARLGSIARERRLAEAAEALPQVRRRRALSRRRVRADRQS